MLLPSFPVSNYTGKVALNQGLLSSNRDRERESTCEDKDFIFLNAFRAGSGFALAAGGVRARLH